MQNGCFGNQQVSFVVSNAFSRCYMDEQWLHFWGPCLSRIFATRSFTCSVDATGIDLIELNDRFGRCGVLSLSTRMLLGRLRGQCFFEACLACMCSHVCTVRKPYVKMPHPYVTNSN